MDNYVTVVEVEDANKKVKIAAPAAPLRGKDEKLHKLLINLEDIPKAKAQETENVTIIRLTDERLGFGLKFQGGTRNDEKVQKLYIQSCAPNSPASRLKATWGPLREGDEIVSIESRKVHELTRIECVSLLKEKLNVNLEVRNGMGQKIEILEEESTSKTKEKPKPPPVPPRKILKKRNKQQAPQPPEAEQYLNACEETTLTNGKHEYESDDTASTISTVIDKLSLSSSNFSSEIDLTQSSSEADLAKVLKPFILLEKEFNIEISQIIQKPSPQTIRKDYENVDVKRVDYENVELRPKVLIGAESSIPTPKPRNSFNSDKKCATLEPKRRTAIPTPRKSNSFKEEKEVPLKKVVSETKSLPMNNKSMEIVTKIPKAINFVLNRPTMTRAKTDIDMKSKIPVKKLPGEILIKRPFEKQKSETDLKKSNLPIKQVKSPPTKLVLHRSNSTEIRYNYSERSVDEQNYQPTTISKKTVLPMAVSEKTVSPVSVTPTTVSQKTVQPSVISQKTAPPTLISPRSAENKTIVEVKATEIPKPKPPTPKARGPKPKPPERVDSLKKIEKPNVIQIKDIAETSPLPQEPQKLLQTFKVQQKVEEVEKVETKKVDKLKLERPTVQSESKSPSPNREIKFKIQTYETSMAERESSSDNKKTMFTFTDVNGNSSENSFYILPDEQKKTHTFYLNPRPAVNAVTNHKIDLNSDEVHECPIVVGKCTKVMDGKSTYYSSSEEEDEVEEGEKLGPPELVNGPGPSEAYFNMFWHANLLPTIGEVEEEMSSLEPGTTSIPKPKQQLLMKAGAQSNEVVKVIPGDSLEKIALPQHKCIDTDKITTPNETPTIKPMIVESEMESKTEPSVIDATKNLLKSEQKFSSSNEKPQAIIKSNEVTTKAKIIDAVPKNPLKTMTAVNVLPAQPTTTVATAITEKGQLVASSGTNGSSIICNNDHDEIERIILGVETKTTNHKEAVVIATASPSPVEEEVMDEKKKLSSVDDEVDGQSFNDLKNNKSKDSKIIESNVNNNADDRGLQLNVVAVAVNTTVADGNGDGESDDNQIIKKCENVIQSSAEAVVAAAADHQCDNGDKVNEKEVTGPIFEIKSDQQPTMDMENHHLTSLYKKETVVLLLSPIECLVICHERQVIGMLFEEFQQQFVD
ncbi:IL16 family protein [Megaselia abdita]